MSLNTTERSVFTSKKRLTLPKKSTVSAISAANGNHDKDSLLLDTLLSGHVHVLAPHDIPLASIPVTATTALVTTWYAHAARRRSVLPGFGPLVAITKATRCAAAGNPTASRSRPRPRAPRRGGPSYQPPVRRLHHLPSRPDPQLTRPREIL